MGNLVPADRKLYALRDVTATVDSLPLIASSIMSKKLASGSDVIVLDVKTGSGAFMKDPESSGKLAEIMVDIGRSAGKKIVAFVTDMNQPLGNAVGNALEVQEAVEILKGMHEGDLKTVSLSLAAMMVFLSGLARSLEEAEYMTADALNSGRALSSLADMIAAQGGDRRVADNCSLLPQAGKRVEVLSDVSGYIQLIRTDEIGLAASLLGSGRMKKEDRIDPAVGYGFQKGGDYGKVTGWQHFMSILKLPDEAVSRFKAAYTLGKENRKSRISYTV